MIIPVNFDEWVYEYRIEEPTGVGYQSVQKECNVSRRILHSLAEKGVIK